MNRILKIARPLAPLVATRASSQWSLGVLNHVAIAVPDLDEATAFYRDVLKGDVTGKEDLPEHGVTTGKEKNSMNILSFVPLKNPPISRKKIEIKS